MKSTVIKNLVSRLNAADDFDIALFGHTPQAIAKGIEKYQPNEAGITQITVFEENGRIEEAGFLTEPEPLTIAELSAVYGEPALFYNFRDEFTRFEFPAIPGYIDKIYCDIEGHWLEQNGQFVKASSAESAPTDIPVRGFSIRLKSGY